MEQHRDGQSSTDGVVSQNGVLITTSPSPDDATWGIKLLEDAKTTDSHGDSYPHTTYVNPRYSLPYSQEMQKLK
jgi:hypothetical protein